jgi:hypothetical protein
MWCRRALAAGAALALLAGCSTTAPTPVASPTAASVAPSPTPTVEAVSAPQPLIDLTCAELGAALPLDSTFATAVSEQNRANSEYQAWPSSPEAFLVRQLGGLVCEFSNGEPDSKIAGSSEAYVGVNIYVLPDAAEQWAGHVERSPDWAGAPVRCSSLAGGFFCVVDGFGSDRWVEVFVKGALTESAGTTLANAALALVTTAGSTDARWAPPSDTLALPDRCDAILAEAQVQAATGSTRPFQVVLVGGLPWGLYGGAQAKDPTIKCAIGLGDEESYIGDITMQPGGEWAWAEAQTLVNSTRITIAGLGPDDEAWLRCGPAEEWCIVDLVLGHNWIEVYVQGYEVIGAFDHRAAVQALAVDVVGNILP